MAATRHAPTFALQPGGVNDTVQTAPCRDAPGPGDCAGRQARCRPSRAARPARRAACSASAIAHAREVRHLVPRLGVALVLDDRAAPRSRPRARRSSAAAAPASAASSRSRSRHCGDQRLASAARPASAARRSSRPARPAPRRSSRDASPYGSSIITNSTRRGIVSGAKPTNDAAQLSASSGASPGRPSAPCRSCPRTGSRAPTASAPCRPFASRACSMRAHRLAPAPARSRAGRSTCASCTDLPFGSTAPAASRAADTACRRWPPPRTPPRAAAASPSCPARTTSSPSRPAPCARPSAPAPRARRADRRRSRCPKPKRSSISCSLSRPSRAAILAVQMFDDLASTPAGGHLADRLGVVDGDVAADAVVAVLAAPILVGLDDARLERAGDARTSSSSSPARTDRSPRGCARRARARRRARSGSATAPPPSPGSRRCSDRAPPPRPPWRDARSRPSPAPARAGTGCSDRSSCSRSCPATSAVSPRPPMSTARPSASRSPASCARAPRS